MKNHFCTIFFSFACWFFVSSPLLGQTDNQKPPLRAAFPLDTLRSVTPADAKLSAEILVGKFFENEGYEYSASVLKNHDLLITGLEKKQHDFYLMFGYEFLQQRENLGIRPLLVGVYNGDVEETNLLLLIDREQGIEGVKGGELCIQNGSGKLPLLWLEEEFAVKQLPSPNEYFGKITLGNSTNQSVLSVFFGKKAACIVSQDSYEVMVELNPQLDKKLIRYSISPPLQSSVICVRDDFKETREGAIQEIGVDLHKDPDGAQVLALMGVKKLKVYRPELMESLSLLLEKRQKRLSTDASQKTSSAK